MAPSTFAVLATAFVLCGLPFATSSPLDRQISLGASSQSQSQSLDADDLTFIKKWAAIGDSYAAGIGAGNNIDKSCARYDSAYPNLINNQLSEQRTDIDFSFVACSGAKVPAITDQANSLSGGQQMITISAGGNDADLAGGLNACVFTWYLAFSYLFTQCDDKLKEMQDTIDSNDFSSSLDRLVSAAKSKLAPGGIIYYTGYAQFFDASSSDCDSVSWHILQISWLSGRHNQYLTQARRRKMNDLVVSMNSKIQAAVQRGGNQVVFVDYDPYVGLMSGRYCMPGVNEAYGAGAMREYLFFYEMKTTDAPLLAPNPKLKPRQGTNPALADSTDDQIQSWLSQTLQQYPDVTLDPDNASPELEAEYAREQHARKARKRAALPLSTKHGYMGSSAPYPLRSSIVEAAQQVPSDAATSKALVSAQAYPSGSVLSGKHLASAAWGLSHSPGMHPTGGRLLRATGGVRSLKAHPTVAAHSFHLHPTASRRKFPTGTGAASTGMIGLSDGTINMPEEKIAISDWISDGVKRVFHPQQYGHALIANVIAYQMGARNAASLSLPIPPENLTDINDSCPMPPSPACNGSTSETWSSLDAVNSAASSFCGNYRNVAAGGAAGKTTSATFNPSSLDYLSLSIDWKDDMAISESQCKNWFGTVINGCDTDSNTFKHGGAIGFATNATLVVEPLVVRQKWPGGQVTENQCNGLDNNHYMTQTTLAANIQNYCAASATLRVADGGTTFMKDYNGGTPDHVGITTSWPAGRLKFEVFEEECNFYLNNIMNGCDAPQGASNPMNWKHGGHISDHNQVTYTISPQANRPPPPDKPVGICWGWYKPYGTQWYVYGGGFASSQWGQEDGGLLAQIHGCSAVTSWKFDYYAQPAADGTEWSASGTLTLGMRGCLGRAVASAGGYSGSCSGNGL